MSRARQFAGLREEQMKLSRRAALSSLLLGTYSAVVERYAVEINEYPVYSSRIPPAFDGFRIAVIADLHYGKLMPEFWIKIILDQVMKTGADAIFGVGDYVSRSRYDLQLQKVWSLFRTLRAPSGVYFVNGNHDHWANSRLASALLRSSGFNAEHTVRYVDRGASRIAIAGAGDLWEGEFLLDSTLKKVNKNIFRIILAHNPDSADLPRGVDVDIFVSGHTHGGQFRVPFINYSPVIPVKNKKYNCGMKENARGEKVFISRGLGYSIIPLRFNAAPEIPVLVLRRREA